MRDLPMTRQCQHLDLICSTAYQQVTTKYITAPWGAFNRINPYQEGIYQLCFTYTLGAFE